MRQGSKTLYRSVPFLKPALCMPDLKQPLSHSTNANHRAEQQPLHHQYCTYNSCTSTPTIQIVFDSQSDDHQELNRCILQHIVWVESHEFS